MPGSPGDVGPASPVESDETLMREGFAALQASEFDQAAWRLRQVRERRMEWRLLLGLALGGAGDAASAAPLLVAVAAEQPGALHPCLDLVTLLKKTNRQRDAEPVIRACLALAPQDHRLHLTLGQFLYELHRLDEAEAAVRESLRLEPRAYTTLNQLAIVVAAQNRTGEALALFRRIVSEDPQNAPAWANLACTLTAEGGFEEALAAYRRSIQIKPAEPQVRLNHSIALLKAGRMVQGWQEHEWRLKLPGHSTLAPDRMLPNLGPRSDVAGRSVLVTHEEGLGDTLMYLRYVPLLGRLGLEVVVCVPEPLARLAARVEGVAGVTTREPGRLEQDFHCPFISLPRAFSATADSWGVPAPYLHTDPGHVAQARAVLPETSDLRVGLVWGGAPRPDIPTANMIDRKRSLPFHELAPLAALRGVSLVNLQLGPHADALRDPPPGLVLSNPMGVVGDLDDTASLIRNLDLVVTVDTSMVHLAGGLGVPTILLDRYDNCWRWFHGRNDSPWYPSVTIVRQETMGDWTGVVRRLLPMLQEKADAHARTCATTAAFHTMSP